MGRNWILVTALALMIVGSIGLGAVVAAGGAYQAVLGSAVPQTATTTPAPSVPADAAIGETIYVTGVGIDGPITYTGGPAWFQRMGGGCAVCHGADGAGRVVRMMGVVTDAPDIRYATLAQVGSAEPSATVGPWSDADIVNAIRLGREPDGSPLDPSMPVWNLTDANAQALLDYLKELK